MRILVIEDDAETAAYVVGGLRKSGHIADQVSDGREGLVTVANGSYDVLIVDRMLPGLDGMALVRTIRGIGIKDRVEGLEARLRPAAAPLSGTMAWLRCRCSNEIGRAHV